jgi:uncharacterized protein
MRQYNERSWINPSIERRSSAIHGYGKFAISPIKTGEVIFIFGRILLIDEDLETGKTAPHSVTNVEEGLYLDYPAETGNTIDDYLNCSCDPNVWLQDEVTLVPRRDIASAVDYSMYLPAGWKVEWQCKCGTPLCHETVSGDDWQVPELHRRYNGHFAPFILAHTDQSIKDEFVREYASK